MPIINRIADFHADMTAWRRELHQHPELSFEEKWTSDFVAKQLESFGIESGRAVFEANADQLCRMRDAAVDRRKDLHRDRGMSKIDHVAGIDRYGDHAWQQGSVIADAGQRLRYRSVLVHTADRIGS